MASNTNSARLVDLDQKLQHYISGSYKEEDEDSENSREQMDAEKRKERYFLGILGDICNVIRGATAAPDHQDLLQADKLLNKAVNHAHAKTHEEPYMGSFAHSDAHPEVVVSDREDLETVLGYGVMEGLLPIMLSLQNGVPPDPAAAAKYLKRSPPWAETPKPHPSTSRLSRFKPDVTPSAASAAPTTNFIYQARCEITEGSTCNPMDIKISSGSTCMAITSAGGWKGR